MVSTNSTKCNANKEYTNTSVLVYFYLPSNIDIDRKGKEKIMLITTAFTGKILKQYIKDHRMEHYDILGLEGGEIEDNEMYALHPYTTP